MSAWDSIRGHQIPQAMLRIAANRTRLAHAFLFVGHEGIGKHTFAKVFAQTLLCERTDEKELDACGECDRCHQVLAGTHPDLLEVGLPEGKSEIPIDLIVGKGDQRGKEGLLHELSLRPMAGVRRIAILDHAEKLNISSANALLKTLEEPPDNAIIILITSDLELMLDTIRSRCQSLFFGSLESQDVRAILENVANSDDDLSLDSIPEFAIQSGSVKDAMISWNPEVNQLRDAVNSQFQKLPFDAVSTKKQLNSILDEIGGGTKEQRDHAGMIIQFVADFWNSQIRNFCESPASSLLSKCSNDALEMGISLLDRTLVASEALSRNVSVPLCLDSLWNDLSRIQKRELSR